MFFFVQQFITWMKIFFFSRFAPRACAFALLAPSVGMKKKKFAHRARAFAASRSPSEWGKAFIALRASGLRILRNSSWKKNQENLFFHFAFCICALQCDLKEKNDKKNPASRLVLACSAKCGLGKKKTTKSFVFELRASYCTFCKMGSRRKEISIFVSALRGCAVCYLRSCSLSVRTMFFFFWALGV